MRFFLTFFLIAFSFKIYAQTANQTKLSPQTYFDCFSFDVPNNLTRASNPDLEKLTGMIIYRQVADSIDLTIKMKEAYTDLTFVKSIHESMATSFYKGTIQKSEFVTINEQNVLVFLMTGYWNGANTLSTWMKCFVVSKDITYQFLIRFPKEYKDYDNELLNKMVSSIKLCK